MFIRHWSRCLPVSTLICVNIPSQLETCSFPAASNDAFLQPGDRSVDRSLSSMEDQVIDHDMVSMDQDANSLGEGGGEGTC